MTDQKQQLILGLDLDGVVFDYESAVRERFAAMLGVDPSTLGRQKYWSLVQSGWPIADENHFAQLHSAAVKAGMFAEMPVIAGASEALWRLSDAGIYTRIVTHRLGFKGIHQAAASGTVLALESNNIPYRDLTFVANKPDVGADIYVDDAPHNIAALRKAGRHAIVFDQPYNQHVDGARARNWDELATMIEEYAVTHGFRWEPPVAPSTSSIAALAAA